VKSIKNSGEALLALIEEILDFSKIEAGRLDLQSRPFDLAGLVTDAVELLAPRAQNKGIEIAAEIADDVPARVAGDAARLRQVLLNLAGNAVKFTENGGVLMVVERGKNDQIRFIVEDSGPGVGADAQARIFEEFEQGDGTLARRHGGTGLGLAIAGRIVERMGGEIALHSGHDGGSVFSFSIDLPAVADTGGVTAFAAPDISSHDILIASPSRIVGPMLERKLTAWGANVALAPDVRVAETLLPERAWTHLFVDRGFGAEAAVALAGLAAGHAREKLVLLAPAERPELPELREAGFDGYFVKPVRAGSLAVRLAADTGEQALLADFDADRVVTTPRMRALAVLIAEDNEINALLAQAMLGKLGHIPTVVADGNAAVNAVIDAHAMGAPYDLVLMDLHLPGMDGLEATRKIRALPGAGRVPVIALTANAFAEDRAACSEAGMDAFVVKPFDRDQLDEAISKARGINALRAANAA
jgi:CheY-like chemotaxis protein